MADTIFAASNERSVTEEEAKQAAASMIIKVRIMSPIASKIEVRLPFDLVG